MNYKALALGAAVGFLFTLSPSCGPAKDDCTQENCAGCCTEDGTCIEPGATSPTQCGANGQSCIACTGNLICNATGQCTSVPTDGGTDAGDGGDPSACGPHNHANGCCAGDIQLAGNSNSNCGTGGAACTACVAPAVCTNQACVTPPPPEYGKACETNADCASVGSGALCKKTTNPGGAEYVGGYCTKPCGAAGQTCGAGSTCINASPLGEFDRLCLQTCTPMSTDECRTDYACYTVTNSNPLTGICFISPQPVFDGGRNAADDLIGSPCTMDEDCQMGGTFLEGHCISGVDPQMAPTGWTDGYCSADCTNISQKCGTTGICLGISSTSNLAWCFDRCSTANGGQVNCNSANYVCEGYTSGGNPSVDGYCSPHCSNPGAGCTAPATCNDTTGYCG